MPSGSAGSGVCSWTSRVVQPGARGCEGAKGLSKGVERGPCCVEQSRGRVKQVETFVLLPAIKVLWADAAASRLQERPSWTIVRLTGEVFLQGYTSTLSSAAISRRSKM